ncbi:FAD-binding protein [Rhodomicrobium lacus]|uniref:FAD-binding protein n=1 Tax=Rhodomicrobium TaxID=1068 RepID=UPI0026E1CE4D|nr:FAD-binding protein [Rhodomicrobium lacus]WKW49960.1 FAD-binding protein [Rhodomicrobium lacus]
MSDVTMPTTEAELADFVKAARASGTPIEVCGFRSKREAGRPANCAAIVSTAKLGGITFYEPSELVVRARAGTPLHELEATLARKNQELAFEPADLSRIYGPDSMAASLGAVAAMNISGPRRVLRGAARDYLLGLRAINGEGETINSGGRVMKNVTGVDLTRGLCGSWGTLAVITELTFKVLPRAPETRTVFFVGLADEAAVGVMSAAMGTPYEVSGTVHLHGALVARLADPEIAPAKTALTALRLEGSPQSLTHRIDKLRRLLSPFGESYELDHERSRFFWADIRSLAFLSARFDRPLWRISVAPSRAAPIVRALSAFLDVRAAYEWSGGLLWLELPPSADASVTDVRRVLAEYDADSMLMRAPRSVRSGIEVFHPQPVAKMNLVRAVKKSFDPEGILNPGRMYAGV